MFIPPLQLQFQNAAGKRTLSHSQFPLSDMVRSILTTSLTNKVVSFAFARETKEELTALAAMIEGWNNRIDLRQGHPMDQAADTHRRVEAEKRLGAVVIAIDDLRVTG